MKLVLNSESLQVINLLIAFVIPLLVALVTNKVASGAVKSITLIVLTVILSVITEWRDDGGFVVFDAFVLFIQNFVVAITAHYGFLKPAGLSGTNGAVASAAPKGIR